MSLPLFIHGEVDDFGLSATEFRVLAHIARRAGEGACWASMASIAEVCHIRRNTAFDAVQKLEDQKVLLITRIPGRTNQIQIRPITDWTPTPKEAPPQKRTRVSKRVDTHPERSTTGVTVEAPPPTPKEATQSYSNEVTPIKLPHEVTPSGRFGQIALIDPLDGKSDSFKASWAQWLSYRQHIKGVKKLQQVSIDAQLREVTTWTDSEFSDAVTKSIASGWRSLNRRQHNSFRNSQPKVPKTYSDAL